MSWLQGNIVRAPDSTLYRPVFNQTIDLRAIPNEVGGGSWPNRLSAIAVKAADIGQAAAEREGPAIIGSAVVVGP
jgi:hypothetical protein